MTRKKELSMAAKLAGMLCLAATLSIAQTSSVTIGTAGNGNCQPYSCGYDQGLSELQQHFAASAFGVSGPISINSFVLTAWPGNSGPGSDTGTFNIYLSTAVNALGKDSTALSSNIGADNVLFATVAFGPTITPTVTVNGNAPFNYNPANGDLLIDVQFTGSTNKATTIGYYFNADLSGTATLRNYIQDGAPAANVTEGLVTQFVYTPQNIITFAPLSNQVYGVAPFTVSATASSGLPVTFNSQTISVCSVSGTDGTTVTVLATGTCTIQATQSGNTDYPPATPVNQSFTVSPSPQTITFGSLSNQVYGSTPPPLSATASSGLPVSFNSQTPSVCTVSGNTVTLAMVGTCTIQATQAGNVDYTAATPVNRSFSVTQASQTITFGALGNQPFGATPPALSATASSSLSVSFNSQTLAVCTVSGNTVTLVMVGTCTIQATQAGNVDYAAAAPVSQSFTVTQGQQTITFNPIGNQTLGSTPPALSATATSGLTVSFTSTTLSVCTVSGTAMTLLTVGTCTIQASQAGNADYAAATPVNRSFTVSQKAQTITFAPIGNQTLGSVPPSLSATASSGLPVSLNSTTPAVCQVSGFNVQLVAAGQCSITASQPGNTNYAPATPVIQSFTVLNAFSPLQITSSGALGEFLPGASISNTPAVSGGQLPYNWTATGLPSGFNFNASTGAFSGSAPMPGVYSFTLKVTDSESTPQTVTLTVNFSVFGITTSSLPAGTTTSAYSQQIVVVGGATPYSFAATGLPKGLSISASGLITGPPSSVGTFAIVVQVKDATGLSTSASFNLVVTGSSPQPLSVPGGPLPNGSAGSSYSANVTATGGTPPYKWTQTGGILPDGGVTLSGSGAIAGTPKTPGTYSFTVQATDAAGANALGTFSITIAPAMLGVESTSFPIGTATSPYPLQIMSASGGVPPYTFSISTGALPAGLTLASGRISGTPTATGNAGFTLKVIDSTGASDSAATSITINPYSVQLVLSQSTANFSLTVGSNGVPAPASVTIQSNDVNQILNYSVAVVPAVQWLDVTEATNTPGTVSIALDPSALSLGASDTPYQAKVNVTCAAPSPCAGVTQAISVSLTVTASSPQISLTSSLVIFSALTANPGSQSVPVGIQNTGGGTLNIISVTSADSWLTATGVPSIVPAGPAVSMTVRANSAGLAANYYQSTITVVSSNGTIVLPVALSVAQSVTMTLAPSGATIQSVAGNPPGNLTGSFNINVTGAGSINWSAQVQPGASWLSVSTPSGTATAAAPGTVNFAIDPTITAGLAAQAYAGSIQITSSDVVDSPLVFQLFLNVNPVGTPPSPQPGVGGIVYTYNSGGQTPAAVRAAGTTAVSSQTASSQTASSQTTVSSQTIPIYASSTTPVPYQASAAMANGGSWLSVSPSTGFASASAPGQSVISANPAGLPPGTYRGGVTYAFSSNGVSTVNITLLVGAQGATLSSDASAGSASSGHIIATTAAGGCAPTKLVATQTGSVSNFLQAAGWPIALAVAVQDDCLNTVTNAQVNLTFSNGDPPKVMTFNNSSRSYFYTWTPSTVASQVTVTGLAAAPGLASASVQITGQVVPNNPPTLNADTPTHVWNPVIGGSLAPGTIISIYGSNLAAAPLQAEGSVGTTLGNTSVLIGGIPVPLYYAGPTQINAQVPFQLTAGNQYQVIVVANGVPTATPATIQMTPAVPGIATYLTGAIIAQHVVGNGLITADSPAVPGEYVVFYLAGLGATDNPVGTGQPASGDPLSHALAPVTLTLNGSQIKPLFSGLTPTAVGLYQVDFQVPMDTPSGNLKLVVSQEGLPSNSTLLPVQ